MPVEVSKTPLSVPDASVDHAEQENQAADEQCQDAWVHGAEREEAQWHTGHPAEDDYTSRGPVHKGSLPGAGRQREETAQHRACRDGV